MTYAIVIAILVLALIAVVVAVVVTTEEDQVSPAHEPGEAADRSASDRKLQPPVTVANAIPEENQARDIGIVDVPEEADRNAGAFRV